MSIRKGLLAIALFAFPLSGLAQPSGMPNGELNITYRQKVDGELSKSVHRLTLTCSNGACRLRTLTLNQCLDLSNGKAFIPKIAETNTEEGNLKVSVVKPGILAVEESYDGAVFRYRMGYSVLEIKDSPAVFMDIVSFTGAVIKNSEISEKVLTWELEPLKGRHPRIALDCKAELNGIPE